MAIAIKKYENGLSIRFIKSTKGFHITYGVEHVTVDGRFPEPFKSFEEAENFINKIEKGSFPYHWHTKKSN